MSEQQAWEYVYNTLMEGLLCRGIYDAKNGNKYYMYGIAHVMERIAYEAGVEDTFYDTFYGNMERSEAKVVEE